MSEIHCLHGKTWRLLSMVLCAIMMVSFITPYQVNIAYAFAVPQPQYPENYASTTAATDPPLGVPSFSWSMVEGATKYRLQVDNDIAFSSPIMMDILTPNTSYTPVSKSHLFSDGLWYWRVRVEQPTPVGEWSDAWEFNKLWATGENKPTLLAPDDGVSLGFFTETDFSWTPVLGAASYRFQIASSPDGFATPKFTIDTLGTTYQPAVTNLANGTYYWQVIPMDAANHIGTTSDVRAFDLAYGRAIPMDGINLVPTLLEPENESFPTFTPTFHWEAVEGAEHYRLQYTSDKNCDFSAGASFIIDTRQTSYTPTDTLPNDEMCWHVRVDSSAGEGDWSPTWRFTKQWTLQPQLLTPTNGYQTGLYPLYSWTPVPGAAQYRIDISKDADLSPIFESKVTANTTYAPQSIYEGTAHYYWEVTPIDGGGELGSTSARWGFQSYFTSTAPILVYPLYYYIPNNPTYYGGHAMNPAEDRTVAYPIFIWHRVMVPSDEGGIFAEAYRIQVDTDPYFTPGHPVWEYDTENTSASPTVSDNFHPIIGQDYFWRVCVLNHLGEGGSCIMGPSAGWSQIWRTRFDDSMARGLVLPPTTGSVPELLRPKDGQEVVDATPRLEWYPLQDATQYQVEVDRDPGFSTVSVTNTATTEIPAYAPWYNIAQRNLERNEFGTYYWHVRGFVNGAWTGWSETWRFQIAAQSEWRYNRSIDQLENRLLIGEDPAGDASQSKFDLTSLYATEAGGYIHGGDQIQAYWFFGFTTTLTTADVSYLLYIDEDHVDGSGADVPPEPLNNFNILSAHQPEYAIYVKDIGAGITVTDTLVYAWNGVDQWGFYSRLNEIGGSVYILPGITTQYVQLQIPNEAINMNQVTSSASVMLFSINADLNTVEDSVPSDPSVPGVGLITRFSAVSGRMTLVAPPSTASGDPSTISSLLPFYWDWPTGSDPSTPWAGSVLEVYLDEDYTTPVDDFTIKSNAAYFGENNVTFLWDLTGDNIYYWRVQPRYSLPAHDDFYGPWTGGWSFRRFGFTPKNLQTTGTCATPGFCWGTPKFSWDMVEGASNYRLQVSSDPNFSTTPINVVTPMTSYTPPTTLAQGIYYMRVQANRYGSIMNDWSDVISFTLTLPSPTGLTPDGEVVHYAPQMCWDPLIKLSEIAPNEPILTAWKYRLQVSKDENFSSTFETIDTHNNCWTPSIGYADGTYYWHVAMLDGNGKLGPYSSVAIFTKQYPITTLISPPSGSIPSTPTFIWSPVTGAATYRFEISLYKTFSPLYDSVETINTQFTPIKLYALDDTYFWRVAIKDKSGNLGPFTGSTIIIGKGSIFLPIITR